jgi:hypothetical protein
MVSGLSASFIPQLLALVGIAWRHSMVLQLCLWSFDLCEHYAPGAGLRANLIQDAAKTHRYITHALRLILAALDGAAGRSQHVVIEGRARGLPRRMAKRRRRRAEPAQAGH